MPTEKRTTPEMVQDPELYRELSKPYATSAEAEAATHAFLEEVIALRAKHRVPEILVAAAAYVVEGPDGQASTLTNIVARGNSNTSALLAAAAYQAFAAPALQHARQIAAIAGLTGEDSREPGAPEEVRAEGG